MTDSCQWSFCGLRVGNIYNMNSFWKNEARFSHHVVYHYIIVSYRNDIRFEECIAQGWTRRCGAAAVENETFVNRRILSKFR